MLDTHIWIWWVAESPRLSKKTAAALSKAAALGVPAICCWEVAMLVAKGRLGLSLDTTDWLRAALKRPNIRLLPLSPEIAALSMRLPGDFHGDPADRLIVATALSHNARLATMDSAIRDWAGVALAP